MRPSATALLIAAMLAWGGPLLAAPQASVGTTVGGAITDMRMADGPSAAFHLGLRGDVSFFRTREREMGLGPYVELLTEGFDTLETGGGLSWLIPLVPSVPLVVSGGAYARRAPGFGWEPGLGGMLFFGPRGYNFSSWYGMGNGFFVAPRYGLGDSKQFDLIIGVQIDFMVLALPFIFVVEGLRH
jgi:hypothetical protein